MKKLDSFVPLVLINIDWSNYRHCNHFNYYYLWYILLIYKRSKSKTILATLRYSKCYVTCTGHLICRVNRPYSGRPKIADTVNKCCCHRKFNPKSKAGEKLQYSKSYGFKTHKNDTPTEVTETKNLKWRWNHALSLPSLVFPAIKKEQNSIWCLKNQVDKILDPERRIDYGMPESAAMLGQQTWYYEILDEKPPSCEVPNLYQSHGTTNCATASVLQAIYQSHSTTTCTQASVLQTVSEPQVIQKLYQRRR